MSIYFYLLRWLSEPWCVLASDRCYATFRNLSPISRFRFSRLFSHSTQMTQPAKLSALISLIMFHERQVLPFGIIADSSATIPLLDWSHYFPKNLSLTHSLTHVLTYHRTNTPTQTLTKPPSPQAQSQSGRKPPNHTTSQPPKHSATEPHTFVIPAK